MPRYAIRRGVGGDDRLAAACARLAREKGWPDEEGVRLAALLVDQERRRALFGHPRRVELVQRALAEVLEVLDERGAGSRTVTSDPFDLEVCTVALMMAEGLAPEG